MLKSRKLVNDSKTYTAFWCLLFYGEIRNICDNLANSNLTCRVEILSEKGHFNDSIIQDECRKDLNKSFDKKKRNYKVLN